MTAANVLIADDSLVIRAVVRTVLADEGYHVIEVDDGATAIRQCREQPPDVVLLDIEMPGLDGYQVLAELKRDQRVKDIPVVFLTGRTGMHDVVAGLRAGAHDYLKKPFEPAELVARVGAAAHVKELQDRLRERNDELERVSRTDMLTGLYNRRHLEEQLTRQHTTARRSQAEFGLILLDLDRFKLVNDTYGHAAGDQVLREFTDRMTNQLRAQDIPGRWGGEEFLVILPDTDMDGAVEVGERIRAATAGQPMVVAGIDVSVGVSGGCVIGPLDSPDGLLSAADACLYRAKDAGRNRIIAGNLAAHLASPMGAHR